LRASFVLEHGFDIDTGAPTSSSTFWDRNSWVGLYGSWGELRIGRPYTPAFDALQLSDFNDMGLYANAGTYAQLGGGGNERATPPKDAGRFSALSVAYKNKQLFASAFWQAHKDVFPTGSASSGNGTMTGVIGNCDFGAGVTRYDPAGPDTASAGRISSKWLGVEAKIGIGSLTAQVGTIETGTTATTKPKATLMGIAYRHPLSKRTDLYTTFGRMDNNSASRCALTAGSRALPLTGGVGGDTTGLMLGVRHRF
jgi:general bacterial porin, GBP family